MNLLASALSESWRLLQEMAPSLWIGFLAAGLMAVILPRAWVIRHLAQPGWLSILKSSALGSPMPLCSCGVVPVAAELRKLGASPGAVAAFLVSTPQTGVENILVCFALLGPAFAMASPVAALASGFLVGLVVQAVTRRYPSPLASEAPPEIRQAPPRHVVFARTALRVLPRDLAWPLLAGLLVAGAISSLVPRDTLGAFGGSGLIAKLLVLAISVPLYVCSAASIPVAASLIAAGLSPGAALVFLMAGPATNAATIAVLGRILGRPATAAYLAGLALFTVLFSQGFDLVVERGGFTATGLACHAELSWWHPVLAVGLLLLTAGGKLLASVRKPA
jgi:uncharacterized protein